MTTVRGIFGCGSVELPAGGFFYRGLGVCLVKGGRLLGEIEKDAGAESQVLYCISLYTPSNCFIHSLSYNAGVFAAAKIALSSLKVF